MGSQRARARETEREPIKKSVCWSRGRFAHYVMEDVFEVLIFVSRCEAKEETNRYHGKQRQVHSMLGTLTSTWVSVAA